MLAHLRLFVKAAVAIEEVSCRRLNGEMLHTVEEILIFYSLRNKLKQVFILFFCLSNMQALLTVKVFLFFLFIVFWRCDLHIHD